MCSHPKIWCDTFLPIAGPYETKTIKSKQQYINLKLQKAAVITTNQIGIIFFKVSIKDRTNKKNEVHI